MNKQKWIEEFKNKFGEFYVSIDSKTKAIRIVDIVDGIKVNGSDGTLIECVASNDIKSFIATLLKERDEELIKEIEQMKDKIKSHPQVCDCPQCDSQDGWNSATENIINLIEQRNV